MSPPHPIFEKKVKSGNIWVDAINAVNGDILTFRLAITYLGSQNLSHIKFVDTLPSFLEYKSGGGSTVNVSANKKIIWINISNLLRDGQNYSVVFDALVNTTTVPNSGINTATINAIEGISSYQALDTVSIAIGNDNAPYYPIITGASTGITGLPASFTAKAIDPDGDLVYFMFDWDATGAHVYSIWLGPYPQNTTITNLVHIYSSSGTYKVQAKTKDIHGSMSSWGNQITIVITGGITPPPGENMTITSITGGTKITATYKNNGTFDATNVNWSISIAGKLLKRKNTAVNGTFNLSAGQTITQSLKVKFGFGRVTIIVKVETPSYGSETVTLSGFVIGPIVIGLKQA